MYKDREAFLPGADLSMLSASFKGQRSLKSKDLTREDESRRQEVSDGESTEELAALALAGASIVSSLELDKVLQVVAQQFANLLDVQVCILADWHPNPGGIKAHTVFVNSGTSKLPKGYKPVSFAETLALTEVIENSRPVQKRADDPALSEKERQAFKKSRITSLLLLPLIAQSKTIGLVELQDSRQPRNFSERELYLAQTLSQQAAVAIENARLFEATRRQLQELTLLHQVSLIATEATSEDELISKTTELIHENFYTDNFGILLLEKDGTELHEHPSYKSGKLQGRTTIPLGRGITGQVASLGMSLRVGDTRKDANYLNYDEDSLSELCVPLKIGDRVIGVANAESKKLNHFTEKDERLLLTLAGQLASGVQRLRNATAEHQRAKQLGVLNKLTGEMSGVLDRERLFKIVVERLNKEMNYVSTDISRVDEESHEYVVEAVSGTFAELVSKKGYRQPFGVGLLDIAAKTGEPVVANNVHDQPNYILVAGHEMINSELIIPIKIYKRVIALLNIESNEVNAFDKHEVGALTTLCEQISIALEGINLFDSTRRQLQELTVLHAITHAAVNAQSEDDLLERATEIIGASIYPDQFGFLMLEKERQCLTVNRFYRGVNGEMHGRSFALSQGIAGHVAVTGKPWRVTDVHKEPTYYVVNPSMRSELCVPILGNGNQVLGVINAESAQLDAFTEADLRLLNTIAGQLGTAIEKLRLFESELRQRQQSETLREVAAILGSATESSKVLNLILEQLKRVVPFDSASIQIIKGENLSIRAVAGTLEREVVGYELPILDDKLAHPLLYEHRTVLYEDIENHPDWLQGPGATGVKSWIGAPLIVRGECIGVLTVDGYEANQFSQADAQLVSSFAIHAGIALENARLLEEAEDAYVQTVSALASAIDVRDSYTSGHSQRLAELAVKIGQQMGCDEQQLEDIRWGALLHDIGKIGVPDEILRKPGSLESSEMEIMRQHPEIGARIVEGVKNLAAVAPIIRAHQERFDGSGYPNGLHAEAIPLIARIVSVADAYVAMTDERVYRKARSHEAALAEIKHCVGSQFDPTVVDAFLKLYS